MHFIDEENDVRALCHLCHHIFEPLFKFAAVFCPGNHGWDIYRDDGFVPQHLWNVAVRNAFGKPLDHGGFANAGLADETGIILLAAGKNLDDPLGLRLASDSWVERAFFGKLGQIPPVACQRRAVPQGTVCARLRPRRFAGRSAARRAVKVRKQAVFQLVCADAERLQHSQGNTVAFFQQGEQQMLGADIAVPEARGGVSRHFDDLLDARRQIGGARSCAPRSAHGSARSALFV